MDQTLQTFVKLNIHYMIHHNDVRLYIINYNTCDIYVCMFVASFSFEWFVLFLVFVNTIQYINII